MMFIIMIVVFFCGDYLVIKQFKGPSLEVRNKIETSLNLNQKLFKNSFVLAIKGIKFISK